MWIFKQLIGRVDVHKAVVKSTPKATQRIVTVRICQIKIYTSLEIQQRSVKPIIKKCKEDGSYSFSGSDGTVCAWNFTSRSWRVKGGIQWYEGDHKVNWKIVIWSDETRNDLFDLQTRLHIYCIYAEHQTLYIATNTSPSEAWWRQHHDLEKLLSSSSWMDSKGREEGEYLLMADSHDEDCSTSLA